MACTRDLVSAIGVKADILGDALMSANGTSRHSRQRNVLVAFLSLRLSAQF